MPPVDRFLMPPGQRRGALRLGILNGMLWAAGNGLTTSTLVIYLALDLGAKGIAISLILAAPALLGLLRLVSPLLIHLFGTARATCLSFSLASYVVIFGLPALAVPQLRVWPSYPLTSLIAVLCVHQLLEYIASVAFWSWMADLVPPRVRGRYFGGRQMWQLAVLIPTLLLSGLFTDWWKEAHPEQKLLGYAIPTAVGGLLLLASLAPMWRMPATRGSSARSPLQLVALFRQFPLRDGRYLRLLLFGVWFSIANGLTQSAQNIYPYALGLGVFALAAMRTTMRVGQLGASHFVGPLSDRFGNRPVLIVSQVIVASGPLFFILAQPGSAWWIAGAWIVWSAYAGLNICLPNLMLKLSPAKENAGYIAAYFALTNVTYAASTVLGGWVYDELQAAKTVDFAGVTLDALKLWFALGLACRLAAVPLLFWIVEPGAWSVRDVLRTWRGTKPA